MNGQHGGFSTSNETTENHSAVIRRMTRALENDDG
jgi:hypothetical protein